MVAKFVFLKFAMKCMFKYPMEVWKLFKLLIGSRFEKKKKGPVPLYPPPHPTTPLTELSYPKIAPNNIPSYLVVPPSHTVIVWVCAHATHCSTVIRALAYKGKGSGFKPGIRST